MNKVVPITYALPMLGMACSLLLGGRRSLQRAITLVCLAGGLGTAIGLLVWVDSNDRPAVATIGGWAQQIGINYVVDRLAAVLLVIGFATMLIVLLFALGQRSNDEASPYYHPAFLALAAGIAAAFSTGDLFHLFVAFEVLLMASYVLLTLPGREAQVRSGTTYVIINCVESIILLSTVGLVYAATGTLSLADLPEALSQLDPALRTGLQLLLLIAFGLKAAVFPLFFWLPDSYPTALSPVSAVFAGLLTKVGVYALLRTQTLLFPGQNTQLIVAVAALTMLVGVLGALAQDEMKRILSFHIVSQIGYMVMGIAINTTAAIAATVFYLVHHIPTKTSLFLVEGIVESVEGTGKLDRLSGLAKRSGILALLFALPALSLAGLPPFSGFVGKFALLRAGIASQQWLLVGVALTVSLLTLVSMSKIWIGAFWGPLTGPPMGSIWPGRRQLGVSTASLVGLGLAIALFAGPLYGLCERTAEDLTTPGRYATQVREG